MGTHMKKYVIISGFNTSDNNRGTAALSYGAINFCVQEGYLKKGQQMLNINVIKKFWKKKYRDFEETYLVDGKTWNRKVIHVFFLEKLLYDKLHISIPFTKFGRSLRNTELVAAINGGDGFSDIYNTESFLNRLTDIKLAMRENLSLVILPQTIGPFNDNSNFLKANEILLYAKDVYVRDNKFEKELQALGVTYKMTKDLSAFMQPEPWNISIKSGSIGINISGLCYSNGYRTLTGQFDNYPELIDEIICHFQKKGKTIYLIPHSYNYGKAEINNDDMEACRMAYERLKNKSGVVFVDKNLTSPQVKYVISKMSFFIGTRMHANFAAIYTGVPLFGLAYSYKFEGAFNANGLDGDMQTAMINNLKSTEIAKVINKIESFYSHE